ncbi:DODA-type extradiol aromatic ring-opening family dioxygenase [Burkholderia glumae]|uniref:Dioxygenase n=1 Tax=Burkholderia glumae TaxID=337 RepID=A0AAP9XZE4_BURGL|nr:class III extradiol ring-cleavage dioxygenase [Burkholderia glumae]ACR27615.1 Extradiol ring-cleavage dioxygenase, class III enzyme, subunit B [Burkholderia glumae BGR1]AJY67162.1 catalytic LigB subunit of aromatic ring-opening dioxygenase family protein [Burkholderia glumae LMG 2196 = ATCC 33617]KHJ63535.1 extradiol ring-cleavage dioxygenase [Burkholderia glumae]MCM2481404.1 dioxygenase [Burkholderia glumae]MCM2508456.1 dioxygenase [Burkholderia glumae]
MSRLPSLYLSHGAPTLPIDPSLPAPAFTQLGAELPRPRAVLMLSAHWCTLAPAASIATRPDTIHDFHGFPRELYALRYPAPGAPELARQAAARLGGAGIAATTTEYGLDHGAWVPMLLMFPEADIPVAQLSIQPRSDAAHHFRVGRALRSLRDEGVMVIGSGQITHNLREADFGATPADADPRVDEFTSWFEERLARREIDSLLDYRRLAPHAQRMHPTDEHLLPVFAALGAADDDYRLGIQALGTYQRVLAMTNYVFAPGAT